MPDLWWEWSLVYWVNVWVWSGLTPAEWFGWMFDYEITQVLSVLE